MDFTGRIIAFAPHEKSIFFIVLYPLISHISIEMEVNKEFAFSYSLFKQIQQKHTAIPLLVREEKWRKIAISNNWKCPTDVTCNSYLLGNIHTNQITKNEKRKVFHNIWYISFNLDFQIASIFYENSYLWYFL